MIWFGMGSNWNDVSFRLLNGRAGDSSLTGFGTKKAAANFRSRFLRFVARHLGHLSSPRFFPSPKGLLQSQKNNV